MLSLKNRPKRLFTKNCPGGFCRVLAVHEQTCQLVLGFSHLVGICGRKRQRRKKGHMNFRALVRWNPVFWVGKNTAVNIKLMSQFLQMETQFGYLIFQIIVLSGYLHCMNCFVLVVQTLSIMCVHFMGFNIEDIKQHGIAQLGLILNTNGWKHVVLELKGSFSSFPSL